MLVFVVIGFMFNYVVQIEVKLQVIYCKVMLFEFLLVLLCQQVEVVDVKGGSKVVLLFVVCDWVGCELVVMVDQQSVEWLVDEVYVVLLWLGGDVWLCVVLEDGQVEYEKIDCGWIFYFNDLYKGCNMGVVWSWFIDVFVVVCLVFCIIGLFLLQMYVGKCLVIWLLVVLGLVVFLLLVLVFIY